MPANKICSRCKKLPKFWYEVEFVSAHKNSDGYGINSYILCNDCIVEINEAIYKIWPEIAPLNFNKPLTSPK